LDAGHTTTTLLALAVAEVLELTLLTDDETEEDTVVVTLLVDEETEADAVIDTVPTELISRAPQTEFITVEPTLAFI